jgi:integrase
MFDCHEIAALIAASPCTWWRAFISLGVNCGLRVREAIWLAWEDIDSSAAAITITGTPVVGDSDGDPVVRPLISSHAERVIALPEEVATDLLRLRNHVDNAPFVFLPPWKIDQLWLDLGNDACIPLDRLAPGIHRDFGRIQRFARLRKAQHAGTAFEQTRWNTRPLAALRHTFIHTASRTMTPESLATHLGLANARSLRRHPVVNGVEATA